MTTIKLEPKLTPANKKLITNDWAERFPEFKVYRPMLLLRRTGPLVVGVCLNHTPASDTYQPTFHAHCLARAFPTVSLTLNQRLKTIRPGTSDDIKIRFHYDHVDEATQRLKDQVKFPMCGIWSLADVVAAYHNYMTVPGGMDPHILYEDVVSYYTWCDRREKALIVLDDFMPTLRSWKHAALIEGGPGGWYAKCRNIIENTDVRQIVEDEVIKHKLTKIPDEGFDCTD